MVLNENHPEFELLKRYETDLPELFILSQVTVNEKTSLNELSVQVDHADGVRCPRTWRWVDTLVHTEAWGPVSPRCKEALNQIQASKT